LEEKLLRLAESNIEIVPADLANYFVLARDGFACLIEKTKTDPPDFGPIGSVCKITSQGFAVVLWDGQQAYFTGKNERHAATLEEIVLFRSFAHDLKTALAG
jgi:hypothetical protein